MSFFNALFGRKTVEPKEPSYMEPLTYVRRHMPPPTLMPSNAHPYVEAGAKLFLRFEKSLKLPGWAGGVGTYSPQELEVIEVWFEEFQLYCNDSAAQKGGDKMVFLPEYLNQVHRPFSAQALRGLGGDFSISTDKEEIPENWRENASTLLKSWACDLSPLSLESLGWLLAHVKHQSEAKDVFRVMQLFPSYAIAVNFYGSESPELAESVVEGVVERAVEALKELQ